MMPIIFLLKIRVALKGANVFVCAFNMGIPYYFKKVSSKFPTTLSASNGGGCARLFLDFNCAIHYCSKKELDALSSTTTTTFAATTFASTFEALLIKRVLAYIDVLVAEAAPTHLVYVSMDGLAPRAKMAQQRNRRYISAYVKQRVAAETSKCGDGGSAGAGAGAGAGGGWDSNAISPGTAFMTSLATAIRAHAANVSVPLILSDTMEPGEGEHKIVDYIRDHEVDGAAKGGDVIYGLDADLIMLALINQRGPKGIRLMREPTFYDIADVTSAAPFIYMDVGRLGDLVRAHIVDYGIQDGAGSVDAIAIYVFLCFFVGNDFVPHLSFIKLKEDGLESLLAAYKKTVDACGGEHVIARSCTSGSATYSIRHRVLWKLFETLAAEEDAAFAAVHERYMQQRLPREREATTTASAAAVAESRIQSWPCTPAGREAGHASRIRPHEKGWRLDYYHYMFASMSDVISDACRNYLDGLQWLVDCYFHHRPHRGWYYHHVYSPTILDLFNHMTCEIGRLEAEGCGRIAVVANANADIIQPHELDLQLLCILPPSSAHLVRPELRPLYSDVAAGCVHMFPKAFGFHTYLKRFLWECHPLLPVPDVRRLRLAIQRALPN
jgi:5'-3' exonuclease